MLAVDLGTDIGRKQLALDAIIRHDEAAAAAGAALFVEPRRQISPRVISLVSANQAVKDREEAAAAFVAILFNGLPTSPVSYVLARQMGGDAKLMAGIITVQTALAIATLPVVLGLLAFP